MLPVRYIVGSVLVAAAVLKAANGAVPGKQAFYFAIVHVELVLAACLFAGVWPRFTRAVLITLFTAFASYGLYLALSGAKSCGCFGSVQMSPWWVVALDVTLLVLLSRWEPESLPAVAIPRRSAMFVASYALAAIPATAMLLASRPVELRADLSVPESGLVILEPATWVGRQLPITGQLDIGSQVRAGEWVVLMFHHDCHKCQAVMPQYQALAERLLDTGSATRVALVETPPYAENDTGPTAAACVTGRLTDQRQWFVQTPVEIKLKDGVVVDVSRKL